MKTKMYATLLATTLALSACQPSVDQEVAVDTGEQPAPIHVQARNPQVMAMAESSSVALAKSRNVAKKMAPDQVMGSAMPYGMMLPLERGIAPSIKPDFNVEAYSYVQEQGFVVVENDPLSTFSVDVDTASYSNIRRFLQGGQLPPVGAVRIEEMVNYFTYSYVDSATHPVAINTELGACPWQPEHKLVQIGIKAKDIAHEDLPPSNLVFLVDISGSMQSANKLGLLKKSMKMLVTKLGEQDRISMVVYAGAERVVLTPTSCKDKETIVAAIETLAAGGSTNGAGGIAAAYDLARQGFMPGGNNRVILASDGDFNVGTSSVGELEKLIEKERKSGVYLTVLGFGMGNYHDSTMEVLADKGNGNYAYIDSLQEAKKVLVSEMAGTLHTVAKDVKLQVEFNPKTVQGYRLVGYKNRRLADEDFNNDSKDAGEMGAGHTVTALYEIIPTGVELEEASVDPLKYQGARPAKQSTEILTVKLRYKLPKEDSSRVVSAAVPNTSVTHEASADFTFASAVAAFGLVLEKSNYAGEMGYGNIVTLAKQGRGQDDNGYRAEFIKLVEQAELLRMWNR